MADAKITIETMASDDGLKKLNSALADGCQNLKGLQQELRNMEKATQNGTKATAEQTAAMRQLQQSINEQKQTNSQYAKAINGSIKEIENAAKSMGQADAGAQKLASTFSTTQGFTTALSTSMGVMAATIITGAVAAIGALTAQCIELGLKTQQTISQLDALKYNTTSATEAYQTFNDVLRNTNYQPEAVQKMGVQLINLGYSAQNAAGLIQLCADASAGLGQGEEGAQRFVETISRIQATGEASSRQIIALKMAGMDLDKAFASVGMTGDQAMDALEKGTLDSQVAVNALIDYMHEFDGSMAKSKNNATDQWGDLQGNLQAICGEIGTSIFDAFNQSEIIQDLVSFTQDLIDMIRGDGCGAFNDLMQVASLVLEGIDNLLSIVITTFKLIVLALDSAYEAFASWGADACEAIRPVIDFLMEVYNLAKKIMTSVGKGLKSEVDKSWTNTFWTSKGNSDDWDNVNAGNNFRPAQRKVRGGGGGGGSKGGGSKALSEEEKAVEALIKKYADADKQKWSLAKSTVELAKVNVAMLTGENKAEEEKRIKLEALSNAHNQLLEGYAKEMALAEKISNTEVRANTIKAIEDQINAENRLYDAKVKASEFDVNLRENQENTKNLLDRIMGDPESAQYKIEQIKKTLEENLKNLDIAAANPDEEAAMTGIAKIINKTPEEIAEEMALKGETLQEFVDQYKNSMAETEAQNMKSISAAGQWHDKLVSYATDVGKNMGNALTDWITGAKSASQAMADFVKDLIKNAIQLMAQWVGVYAMFLAFGLGNPKAASQAATKAVLGIDVTKVATGGYISGPGTATSDSIPAMLSNGEYVLRSSAVDRIGVGVLNAMNAGAMPRFSEGGSVDDSARNIPSGGTVIFHAQSLDPAGFTSLLRNGFLDKIRQELFNTDREFATEVGMF